jgi:hypothetical protein
MRRTAAQDSMLAPTSRWTPSMSAWLLHFAVAGGSPRAFRAWPVAWPSPSGLLGRLPLGLRRSRVGPDDRFCEAVRNDHRVPLTLEGADPDNARRCGPGSVTFSLQLAHLARG